MSANARPVYEPNLRDIRTGWEAVPHTLLRTSNAALSIPVLAAVSTYERRRDPARVKLRQIAADLGLEERTVRRRVHELLDAGELVARGRPPGEALALAVRPRTHSEKFEKVHRGAVRTGGVLRPEAVALFVAMSARQGTSSTVVLSFAELAEDIDRSRRFVSDLVRHLAAVELVTLTPRTPGHPYRAVVHRPAAEVVPIEHTADSAA